MKTLKTNVAEFKKTAIESHQLNQRLTGLYEDIGHVLNRYYEIDEADKGDMDGDGKSEPDSEEYLDSKRDAITKAVKGEALDGDKTAAGGGDEGAYVAKDGEEMKEIKRSLKDVGGVVGIPSLGQIARKFS